MQRQFQRQQTHDGSSGSGGSSAFGPPPFQYNSASSSSQQQQQQQQQPMSQAILYLQSELQPLLHRRSQVTNSFILVML